MSTEERDESQPRPKKVIPSIRRENTDQEGERRPYNQGYNRLRVAMNVDRIGLMEKITVLHTGIGRAVRVLTIITVKAGMATTVRGAMVIVVHLMATIAKVGMEIIARLMATTVKVATTAAARLMEITARRMGMGEDNTIVRLVRIMMARQRLIPLVLPERECLRMV